MRKPWIRGVLTLGILGSLAAGVLLSPAGAAAPLTKAKVKKIATKVANKAVANRLQDDVTSHTITSPTVTTGVTAEATVTCPAGKIATGGGARLTGDYLGTGHAPPVVSIQRSHPTGTPPNGWEAYAIESSITGISWELTAYVLCATA